MTEAPGTAPDPVPGPGAVLVLGEALIDLVPVAGDAEAHRAQPGGAPANVATGLARLATPSWFAGALGNDGFARSIEHRLVSAGVELGLCARPDLPTALAVADPGPEGTGYHFHLQSTATFQLPVRTDVERFAAVYVGGLAAVVEPAASAVAATARAAAAGSPLLVVDPNVRQDRTLDAANGARLLRELCEPAQVVKASDEDLAVLWPDATPDETARELAAGGRLVVLTRGSRGSTAYSGTAEPVSVPAVPVEVVNTIGAGDAFMAAMITWMVSLGVHPGGVREFTPSSVEEMLVFASRVAASVVAQAGTEPSLPVDA
ncbi:PfkB family carbohydrate kinase [Streptomyces sp. NBC_01498]|uniref:PfkB family carbohydrate kinase n=1 Tax=Streptomyces sp. NBC_01498 TaxID=2975870 RepID=UPI002E7B7B23|nr:PfkB family carbohydrate kinase [Streptomyces sp. NBC_01498]WTL23559.1 PfkB family carbohydrate kinase [Streptomyces sp. NBC_01498]